MKRRRLQEVLISRAITALAVALVFFIFATSGLRLNGIYAIGTSNADLIRGRYPIHLVHPEWLPPDMDLLDWVQAETVAQVSVVLLGWGFAIAICWRLHRHPQPPEKIGGASLGQGRDN